LYQTIAKRRKFIAKYLNLALIYSFFILKLIR